MGRCPTQYKVVDIMEEAAHIQCEKCSAVNDANAEFCRLCGEPLPQTVPNPTPQQSNISRYVFSAFAKGDGVFGPYLSPCK